MAALSERRVRADRGTGAAIATMATRVGTATSRHPNQAPSRDSLLTPGPATGSGPGLKQVHRHSPAFFLHIDLKHPRSKLGGGARSMSPRSPRAAAHRPGEHHAHRLRADEPNRPVRSLDAKEPWLPASLLLHVEARERHLHLFDGTVQHGGDNPAAYAEGGDSRPSAALGRTL